MTKSKFRWLIIISLFAQVIAEVIYEGTFYTLPKELQDYEINSEQLPEYSSKILITILLSIILISYMFFAFIAMFKFKRNARTHAIMLTCIGTFSYLFFDIEIKTGLVSIFIDIGNILWGIVLGSMFYSDLKFHFDRKIKDA
ncbi:MAG: hypothetical protein KKH44_11805 [Bacteroidetes bacterium]|nr:hypothetical protein [Bacteroidota bacterium]